MKGRLVTTLLFLAAFAVWICHAQPPGARKRHPWETSSPSIPPRRPSVTREICERLDAIGFTVPREDRRIIRSLLQGRRNRDDRIELVTILYLLQYVLGPEYEPTDSDVNSILLLYKVDSDTINIVDAVYEYVAMMNDEADMHDSDYEESEDEESEDEGEPKKKKARQCK